VTIATTNGHPYGQSRPKKAKTMINTYKPYNELPHGLAVHPAPTRIVAGRVSPAALQAMLRQYDASDDIAIERGLLLRRARGAAK
jgi:hypothetical protein